MLPGSDDTCTGLEAWELLASSGAAPLLEAALNAPEATPAVVQRLRSSWPPRAVAAALELARARAKARSKFPQERALWCDVAGIEQASSRMAADWKSARFERASEGDVADLCCGIGGDAMSLARTRSVLAVDMDPVRAWMAGMNAGCETLVEDVRRLDRLPPWVHIDPARRDADSGRRAWHPGAYQPNLDEVLHLVGSTRGAACKLGPGIPLPLPGTPESAELEFIQEGARLVQAVLWTGALAEHPGARRATILPAGDSIQGMPVALPSGEGLPSPGGCLLEPRPALERAGLVGQVAGQLPGAPCEMAPGLGLLVGAEPAGGPWFIDWRIEAVLPLRERAVRTWMREHDGGEVIVRTRGRAIDVDTWAKALRGRGATQYVLFGLRLGATARAIVTQPVG